MFYVKKVDAFDKRFQNLPSLKTWKVCGTKRKGAARLSAPISHGAFCFDVPTLSLHQTDLSYKVVF